MGRKTVAEPSLQAAVRPAGPDQSSVILAESSSLRTTSWGGESLGGCTSNVGCCCCCLEILIFEQSHYRTLEMMWLLLPAL